METWTVTGVAEGVLDTNYSTLRDQYLTFVKLNKMFIYRAYT
jgi:hypothetical protein